MAGQNNQFSLLSWNVKSTDDVKKVDYLFGRHDDLYFLQEMAKNTFQKLTEKLSSGSTTASSTIAGSTIAGSTTANSTTAASTTADYESSYLEEDNHVYNCILYKSNCFEVCETSYQVLNQFYEDNTDNRVCIEVLKCRNIRKQHKVIVASCHVPNKSGSRADYAKNLLKELDKMSKKLNCPVIVAGDFNCDLLQKGHADFLVPKYNPTIHRVICSGGNGNPCIDFFAYKNFGGHVAVKVNNVVANLACEDKLEGVLSKDNYKFLQYQQRVKKESNLDEIHKFSDHDPLTARLTCIIEDSQSAKLQDHFKVFYFNLESTESKLIVTSMLAGVDPKPDICVFQKVVERSLIANLDGSFRLLECKPFCFIAYNDNKFKGKCISTKKNSRSKARVIKCGFKCLNISGSPSFTLAVCDTNCGEIRGTGKKKGHAESIFKLVEDESSPVILVGRFHVDLFKEHSTSTHGFIVPNYAPTMYRMTHPYYRNPIYVCCDFFAFKNPPGCNNIEILEDTISAETIVPPQGLMTGKYHVSYDLIKSKLELLETLSATITIRGSSQETDVSESESDSDPSESDSDSDESNSVSDESDSGD